MSSDSSAPGDPAPGPPVLQRDRTLAIVLGASEWPSYPDFHSAPSFRRSAHDLVAYLRAENGLNLSPRNVKVLIDSFDDAPEILRQVRAFIRDRRADLAKFGTPATDLLLYYVGHGGFGDNDAFFLSLRSTDEDDPLATSITAESVGRLIREGAAGLRTYLVLDCCFAASATRVFMSGGPLGVAGTQLQNVLPPQGDAAAHVAGELPAYGTALLCASGPRDAAKAPSDLPHTMFTGALLEVLRNGDAEAPAWLSLDDMRRLVRARLEAQFANKAVLPQVHAPQQRMGRVDLVPLFRNSARRMMVSPSLPKVTPPSTVSPELPGVRWKQNFQSSIGLWPLRRLLIGIGVIVIIAVGGWRIRTLLIPSLPELIPPLYAKCEVSNTVNPPAVPERACTRLLDPRVRVYNHDVPLDYCLGFSSSCGPPLWDWYCKKQRFSRSSGGAREEKGDTYIFGDGRYVSANRVPQQGEPGFCSSSGQVRCDGMAYIDCIE